jgi:tRNA (guanine37-N1)-methyltransferase
MLEIDILAVVPELLEGPFSHSILHRAEEKGLLKVRVTDLRTFGQGKYKQIDDYAFGGGAGMVLQPQPLAEAILHLQGDRPYDEIIYLTPDGQSFNQSAANQLSLKSRLLMICGHYKGIDERIRERFVTREISIGDYVLSGGELAAAVVVDAIGRLIPGVLSDETSALTDSFQDNLLAPPVYTRPAEWEGMKVPDILLSGHQAKIEEWRYEQAIARTKARRPDLFMKDEEA